MTIALATEAPAFDLPGVDGRQHSLDDYADTPALAVVWSCNHCPYVQAWEGRMIELQREFGDRGFGLVAINSNDADAYPEDSFEAMQARAEEQGFNFDYLYDEDQSVLNAYGAERTPEVFLFDGDRRLVYHGAIDDSREEDDGFGALLAGRDRGRARRRVARGGRDTGRRLQRQAEAVAPSAVTGLGSGFERNGRRLLLRHSPPPPRCDPIRIGRTRLSRNRAESATSTALVRA